MRKSAIAAGTFLAIIVQTACGEPDWVGGQLPKTEAAPTTPASKNDGATCGGEDKPGIEVEIAKLAVCCEDKGKAHCVPDDKLSAGAGEKLTACADGKSHCLPDSIIAGTPPQTCKSSLGDGQCVSPCIKAVGDKASLLSQETCPAGELCAPCMFGGKPTGACEIGKSNSGGGGGGGGGSCENKDAGKGGDAGAATPAANDGDDGSCCDDQGVCVPADKVPEERKAQLEQKTCKSDQMCAPKENVDPNFKPKKCTARALTGEYEGVCLSTCLKFSFTQKFASAQGTCDDDHRCLPCKIFGQDTGAPGCE